MHASSVTFTNLQRDSIQNNLLITGASKVPIAQGIIGKPGQIGDLLYTITPQAFWGYNGSRWVRLTGVGSNIGENIEILDTSNAVQDYLLPTAPTLGYTATVRLLSGQGLQGTITAPLGTANLTSTNVVKTFYNDSTSDPVNPPIYKILNDEDSFYPTELTSVLVPTGGTIYQQGNVFYGDVCVLSAAGNTIARYGPFIADPLLDRIWIWQKISGQWDYIQQLLPTMSAPVFHANRVPTTTINTNPNCTISMSADASILAISNSVSDTELFIFTLQDGQWIQTNLLTTTAASGAAYIGNQTALNADGTVLAANVNNTSISIFYRSGAEWVEAANMVPTGTSTVTRINALSLSADGTVLAAGSIDAGVGCVWIFVNKIFNDFVLGGGGDGVGISPTHGWRQLTEIVYPGSTAVISVSMSADGQTVAALNNHYGSILINTSDITWTQQAIISALTSGQLINTVSLSADGNIAILSGVSNVTPVIYQRNGKKWALQSQLSHVITGLSAVAVNATASLSADGSTFILGGQTSDGAVYVYN